MTTQELGEFILEQFAEVARPPPKPLKRKWHWLAQPRGPKPTKPRYVPRRRGWVPLTPDERALYLRMLAG